MTRKEIEEEGEIVYYLDIFCNKGGQDDIRPGPPVTDD
jgi:hypothetical protein